MDSYNTPENSSIFNFKRIQNDFHDDIGIQEFYNQIRNPYFLEMRNSNIFAWNSVGGVDLNTPTAIDLDNKTVTYLFNGIANISQELEFQHDIEYTFVIECDVDNTTGILELNSTTEDFIHQGILVSNIAQELKSGINIIRFKMKASGTLGFTEIKINSINITEDINITFKNIILTKGNIALLGAKYLEYDQLIRWNNANDYWEISIDNEVNWERIWTEGPDLDAHLNNLIDQKTIAFIHQDNLLAGEGITITPSIIPDGEGGEWPALTITSEGGGGGGDGDWTREDVFYQSLLEASDYSHIAYNTLVQQENVTLNNGSTYSNIEDIYGVGSIFGGQNDSFETENIISTVGTYGAFYVSAVIEGNANVQVEYATDTGSGFGTWIVCPFKSNVFPAVDFTALKIRITFLDTGITKLLSFGVLFGFDEIAGNSFTGFLETFQGNVPAGTIINIPNGRWYHKDGKSLEIFYDGIRLLEGTDYTEVDLGYLDKSRAINFNIALVSSKVIVFKEIYGFEGESSGGESGGGGGLGPWSDGYDGYTAESFEKLMINTTTGAVTINLPAGPNIGDEVQFIDKHGNFSNNNLTIHGAPVDIMNSQQDLIIADNYAHLSLIYVDNSVGWRAYHYYSFVH